MRRMMRRYSRRVMLHQKPQGSTDDSGYIAKHQRDECGLLMPLLERHMRYAWGQERSVPWGSLVAPYVIEPMNCTASRVNTTQ
ncbi:hypothetical protein KCP70_15415 [Salmonella enterica subsp. enterica]|nr:hypothetical protein KCP70_15415 [Salmonella enterica subsp. enterica]